MTYGFFLEECMLQIKELSIYLKNEMRPLIKNFSFSLKSNDKIAVIGEEGNGKSTLLKAIYDKESISEYALIEGSIYKEGCVIGYLSQEMESKYLNSDLKTYLTIKNVTSEDNIGRYSKLINDLGFIITAEDEHRMLSTFSGGEKIKIQLLVVFNTGCTFAG
jgi:ATPase subunit of ABC transporter with duplicated ATPase domains